MTETEYSGNGTAGREADVKPTGFFFQMPRREWQGLTDEEIMDACSAVWASHPIEVGRVAEAMLKEKNA